MKAPLALTFVILAVGSLWGWWEGKHITNLRKRYSEVLLEAKSLGVDGDTTPAEPTKTPTSSSTPLRPYADNHAKVKEFADKLASLAKELKNAQKSGVQPDPDTQMRTMEIVDGVFSLNGKELKMLVAELKDRKDMDDQTKREVVGFALMTLSQQHPETSLAMLAESSDLLKDDPQQKFLLNSALSRLAKDQPSAALDWIKQNGGKYPDFDANEAKQAVISGAAQQDFGLAFQLMGELQLPDNTTTIRQIAQAADTPEKQTAFLTALRAQAQKAGGDQEGILNSGLQSLFLQVSRSGYERTTDWLKSADLTPQETGQFASQLNYHQTKADTGKWLDWLSTQTLDPGTSENTTVNLVEQWTQRDFKAAGEWLTQTPAGPVKEAATIAYLATVAPYDTDAAVQWADTLPPEKQKIGYANIYNAIKRKDPAAAANFAQSHGLQTE